MDDFRGTTVAEVAELVRTGRSTAREQAERALAAIDAYDAVIGAFVAVDAERVRAEADAVDARIARGDDVGALAGVPLGVKDLEDAVGYVTTHGSALHRHDAPATTDSALVERLRAAGCVVIGKTNTPEFGWQADTVNMISPPTVNPWSPLRGAGGSSGGSAAAIAAGMVPLATGSDGGGSIRIPSAINGLAGLKPSRGRVPRRGPESSTWLHYSTPGPMARTVHDIALALDACVGPDPTDLDSLPAPRGQSWADAVADAAPPRAVLWAPTLGYGTNDRAAEAVLADAVESIAGAGVEVLEVPTVWGDDPVGEWAALAYVALRHKLRSVRGTPAWESLTPGLRTVTDIFADADMYTVYEAIAAGHRRNLRLVELFHRAPLLLCPTIAGQVGAPGAHGTIDGTESVNWVTYTPPFNMTGNPAGTVCAGFTADGMPVGLQVVGPQHADVAVLRAMRAFEQILDLDTVAPLAWHGG